MLYCHPTNAGRIQLNRKLRVRPQSLLDASKVSSSTGSFKSFLHVYTDTMMILASSPNTVEMIFGQLHLYVNLMPHMDPSSEALETSLVKIVQAFALTDHETQWSDMTQSCSNNSLMVNPNRNQFPVTCQTSQTQLYSTGPVLNIAKEEQIRILTSKIKQNLNQESPAAFFLSFIKSLLLGREMGIKLENPEKESREIPCQLLEPILHFLEFPSKGGFLIPSSPDKMAVPLDYVQQYQTYPYLG